MPKLNFSIPVPTASEEAFKKVKSYMNSANDIKKFDKGLSCTFDETEKTCFVKGSQFKGEIQIEDKGKKGSEVQVSIDIPLTLSLFKGKIKDLVEESIKKLFKT